jgi:outer membrane protein OmpA-like peptidoglycan-associated protein
MNSRFIPLAAFAIWSIFCWRWYVCGVKQQCGPTAPELAKAIETDANAITAPDTAGQAAAQNAIVASNTAGKTGASNTSSVAQQKLSDNIESAQVVAVEDHILIHFPYGSTRRVDDDAIDAYLSELASALVASGGKVTLIGHTDNIGDPASNKAMSLERARHIRATLVKKGVKTAQVIVKGMGESKPIGSNDNPRGRYKNRRVEIRLNK